MSPIILKQGDRLIIQKTVEVLKNSGVIAYPTETVYGLGSSIYSKDAIEKLYNIKRIKYVKPISILISSLDMLKDYVHIIPENAQKIIKNFWPGPITLVFERKGSLPDLIKEFICAGTNKIGIRYSSDKTISQIVDGLGHPITSTSANITGSPPARNISDLKKYFEDKIDLIINTDRVSSNEPSTVIDVTMGKPTILREGVIKKEDLSNL